MSGRPVSIVSIVGARPQFVKAAVVSRALLALGDSVVRETLIHTGQHYDDNMSRVFFEELDIPQPDVNLGVGSSGTRGPGGHGAQTGRMLEALERCLLDLKPRWAVVYGDTNSTLAGALAAAKLHVPVAHVEAGLRSWNRTMPEEINRVVADHLSDLLFAPTTAAVENLRREGIPEERIRLVGDVMYDAVLYYGAVADRRSDVLRRLGLSPRGYVLATVHRAENTDDPARLAAIFGGLARVAREIPVVLPLHPRTRSRLAAGEAAGVAAGAGAGVAGGVLGSAGLRLIDPVGYLDMLMLEKHARLVTTDSGGVQKEAFFFRVPCATLRTETEWIELVEAGWNVLVPPSSAEAVEAGVLSAVDMHGRLVDLYGEGDAGARIAAELTDG